MPAKRGTGKSKPPAGAEPVVEEPTAAAPAVTSAPVEDEPVVAAASESASGDEPAVADEEQGEQAPPEPTNRAERRALARGKVPQQVTGKEAVLKKNQWWVDNHQIHSQTVTGPWPHDDRFIVHYKIDVTAKAGPMQGKRFSMEEAALYTVKNGKVVKEEFFYAPCQNT